MRSMSYTFTAFLLVAAIAAPAALARLVAAIAAPAALARPAGEPPALAHEIAAHSAPGAPTWPADPQPTAPAVTRPAPSDDGFPGATAGLMFVAAGIGLAVAVAVVRVRRRPHMTA